MTVRSNCLLGAGTRYLFDVRQEFRNHELEVPRPTMLRLLERFIEAEHPNAPAVADNDGNRVMST